MIQVPPVISIAPAALAIQRLEKSVRTGSHGAVIHCTWTIPHTGAYSIVQATVSVAAETVDIPARSMMRAKRNFIEKRVRKVPTYL
jgi:hypothetical protein